MGDAQFDGGGSVIWNVRNSKGKTGGGNKNKCNGEDNDPPEGSDAQFVVTTEEGIKFFHPATKGHWVKIAWGPETLTLSVPSTATVRKGATTLTTSAKAKKTK